MRHAAPIAPTSDIGATMHMILAASAALSKSRSFVMPAERRRGVAARMSQSFENRRAPCA
jgi:hypothetical protein